MSFTDAATDVAPEHRATALRVLTTIAVPVLMLLAGWASYGLMRNEDANRLLIAVVAIVMGVGGVYALFWAMNRLVDWLPARFRETVRPYVFVGPASQSTNIPPYVLNSVPSTGAPAGQRSGS